MLLGLAIHYLSGIELDPPHAVARLQNDRRGAQLGGADLERGTRAQRAVQEQQCEGPALQQRPHRIEPEARRLIEKRLQFPDAPVLSAGEVRRVGNDNTIASSVICWATVVLLHPITLLDEQNKQKGPGDTPGPFL